MLKPSELRGILHYVPQFRDRTFVIALDASIVGHDSFQSILLDIAVLRSLNIRVALVHGAESTLIELAKHREIQLSDTDGTGITNEATLALSIEAANAVTHQLIKGLSANGLEAIRPNAIHASPMGILKGVDYLHSGRVERVNATLLENLLNLGTIPIMPPLAFDSEGNSFRLNSDRVALSVAKSLSAVKIIYITAKEGLYIDGELTRQILASDLEALLESPNAPRRLTPHSKAKCAFEACSNGIPRVHIINGKTEEGLLSEVFSHEGIGTLVYDNEYRQIRRALRRDVRSILQLIKGAVDADELVKRTRTSIERNLHDFYIFEIDKTPVGCISLHRYENLNKAELACLCVSSHHENQGIGRKLVEFGLQRAAELGVQQVFAVSTQAFTFFTSKVGFKKGSVDDLPPRRRTFYEKNGRKSRVLLKTIELPPDAS